MLGLFRPRDAGSRAAAGCRSLGLTALVGLVVPAGAGRRRSFGGSFVVDPLALFAQRLFLVSAARQRAGHAGACRTSAFARRGSEYHVALLASLLGMLVLAAARELILLFVAFELMSIPLYFLTGFQKRDEVASEGALKFFLVGTRLVGDPALRLLVPLRRDRARR